MSEDPIDLAARRQAEAVLSRWDIEGVRPSMSGPVVESVVAALRFSPSHVELAADLQELARTRLGLRPTWAECLAVAHDLLDGHRLLHDTVIDAA